jgi:hypothetical protein
MASLSRLLSVKSATHEAVEGLFELLQEVYDIDLLGGALGQNGGIRSLAVDASVRAVELAPYLTIQSGKELQPEREFDWTQRKRGDGSAGRPSGRSGIDTEERPWIASPVPGTAWSIECRPSGTPPRVLIADAGHGKSYLTRFAALEHCAKMADLLAREGVDHPSLDLPVWITAGDLAEHGRGASFGARVFAAWREGPVKGGLSRRMLGWAEGRIAAGRARVFIDSLDEVGVGSYRAFRSAVSGMGEWGARVWFTSRPGAELLLNTPDLQAAARFELLPLDESQQGELVSKALGDDAAADQLIASMRTGQPLKQLRGSAQVPLLLRFICAELQSRSHLYSMTPADLYGRFIELKMAGKDLFWEKAVGSTNDRKLARKEGLALLARVAGRLYLADPGGNEFTHNDWQRAWQSAMAESDANRRRFTGRDALTFLDLFLRAGVIVEGSPHLYRFPHRQILEYLFAAYLTGRREDSPVAVKSILRPALGFGDEVKLACSTDWRPALDLFAQLRGGDLLVELMDQVVVEEPDDLFRHCLLHQVRWASMGGSGVSERTRRRLAADVVNAGFGRGERNMESPRSYDYLDPKPPPLHELSEEFYRYLKADPVMRDEAVAAIERQGKSFSYSYGLGLLGTREAAKFLHERMQEAGPIFDTLANAFDLARCEDPPDLNWIDLVLQDHEDWQKLFGWTGDGFLEKKEMLRVKFGLIVGESGSVARWIALHKSFYNDHSFLRGISEAHASLDSEVFTSASNAWIDWSESRNPMVYMGAGSLGRVLLTRCGRQGRCFLEKHLPKFDSEPPIHGIFTELVEARHPLGKRMMEDLFARDRAAGTVPETAMIIRAARVYRLSHLREWVLDSMSSAGPRSGHFELFTSDYLSKTLTEGLLFIRDLPDPNDRALVESYIFNPPPVTPETIQWPIQICAIDAMLAMDRSYGIECASKLLEAWQEEPVSQSSFTYENGYYDFPKWRVVDGAEWVHRRRSNARREDVLLGLVVERTGIDAMPLIEAAEAWKRLARKKDAFGLGWVARRLFRIPPLADHDQTPFPSLSTIRLHLEREVDPFWSIGSTKHPSAYDRLAVEVGGSVAFASLAKATDDQLHFTERQELLWKMSSRLRLKAKAHDPDAPTEPPPKSIVPLYQIAGVPIALAIGLLLWGELVNLAGVRLNWPHVSLDGALEIAIRNVFSQPDLIKQGDTYPLPSIDWSNFVHFLVYLGIVVAARFVGGHFRRRTAADVPEADSIRGQGRFARRFWLPVAAIGALFLPPDLKSPSFLLLVGLAAAITILHDARRRFLGGVPADERRAWIALFLAVATATGAALVVCAFFAALLNLAAFFPPSEISIPSYGWLHRSILAAFVAGCSSLLWAIFEVDEWAELARREPNLERFTPPQPEDYVHDRFVIPAQRRLAKQWLDAAKTGKKRWYHEIPIRLVFILVGLVAVILYLLIGTFQVACECSRLARKRYKLLTQDQGRGLLLFRQLV